MRATPPPCDGGMPSPRQRASLRGRHFGRQIRPPPLRNFRGAREPELTVTTSAFRYAGTLDRVLSGKSNQVVQWRVKVQLTEHTPC